MTWEDYNTAVKNWSDETTVLLRSSIVAQNLVNRGWLEESLKVKTVKTNGIITRITFSFLKYGIYQEYGAGRGGRENRHQRKWWHDVMPQQMEKLFQLVQQYNMEIVLTKLAWIFND